jgi:hypothetical protein
MNGKRKPIRRRAVVWQASYKRSKNPLSKLLRWRPSLPSLQAPPQFQPVPIPIRRDE